MKFPLEKKRLTKISKRGWKADRDDRWHAGTDYSAKTGDLVYASFAGVVGQQTWSGNGNAVVLSGEEGTVLVAPAVATVSGNVSEGDMIGVVTSYKKGNAATHAHIQTYRTRYQAPIPAALTQWHKGEPAPHGLVNPEQFFSDGARPGGTPAPAIISVLLGLLSLILLLLWTRRKKASLVDLDMLGHAVVMVEDISKIRPKVVLTTKISSMGTDGEYLYINPDFIDYAYFLLKIQNDYDAQLSLLVGLLGHEHGHIFHADTKVEPKNDADSHAREFRADAYAAKVCKKAGSNVMVMARLFRELGGACEVKGSHPCGEERYRRLESIAKKK